MKSNFYFKLLYYFVSMSSKINLITKKQTFKLKHLTYKDQYV